MVHLRPSALRVSKSDAIHDILVDRERSRLVVHQTRGEQKRGLQRCLDCAYQALQDNIVACSDDAAVERKISVATCMDIQRDRAFHSEIGDLYGGEVRRRPSSRREIGGRRFDNPARLDQNSRRVPCPWTGPDAMTTRRGRASASRRAPLRALRCADAFRPSPSPPGT